MNKLMVVAAGLLAASFAIAQDVEIVKVKGRGIGTDKTEALKDAYRDAVERAVGLYVDAEQMMENEELVKDQILTQSNAYIEKYDVAKETTKPNGLVEIQILAEVRKTALTKKISDVMPTKTFRLGNGLKNAHAKMATEAKRNMDGAALLKKALEGLNPMLEIMDCELACPDGFIREKREGWHPQHTVSVSYLFKTSINQKRLFENVVPKLKSVLDQISLAEPRSVTIPIRMGDQIDVNAMIEKRRKNPNSNPDGKSCRSRDPFLYAQEIIGLPVNSDTSEFFVLPMNVNEHNTICSGVLYELDDASAKISNNWGGHLTDGRDILFNVSFVDKKNDVVCCYKITPWKWARCFASGSVRISRNSYREMSYRAIVPWTIAGGNEVEFNKYSWHEFDIPKDAMPEIENLKIEIVK